VRTIRRSSLPLNPPTGAACFATYRCFQLLRCGRGRATPLRLATLPDRDGHDYFSGAEAGEEEGAVAGEATADGYGDGI
jgi:hypothetical protein